MGRIRYDGCGRVDECTRCVRVQVCEYDSFGRSIVDGVNGDGKS